MKERPILFSAPMVRAILDGRKTQTRRIVKPQPSEVGFGRNCIVRPYCTGTEWPLAYYERRGACWNSSSALKCPYGEPGSRLWVKETFAPCIGGAEGPDNPTLYRADGFPEYEKLTWKPSIFMPRKLSRINRDIEVVRVERLQDISEEDAIAEGIERIDDAPINPSDFVSCWKDYTNSCPYWNSPVDSYHSLWESINGTDSWAANPLVWVIAFHKL